MTVSSIAHASSNTLGHLHSRKSVFVCVMVVVSSGWGLLLLSSFSIVAKLCYHTYSSVPCLLTFLGPIVAHFEIFVEAVPVTYR